MINKRLLQAMLAVSLLAGSVNFVSATASPAGGRDFRIPGAQTPNPVIYGRGGVASRPSPAVASGSALDAFAALEDIATPDTTPEAVTPFTPSNDPYLQAARERRLRLRASKNARLKIARYKSQRSAEEEALRAAFAAWGITE